MGRIRARSAKAHPGYRVVQVVDQVFERAEALAKEVGCEAGTDWERLVARRDIDAVVVATPHKYLSTITITALLAGLGNSGKCQSLRPPSSGECRAVRKPRAQLAGPSPGRSPVEDNAFVLLRTRAGHEAFLHASWTQWKNWFSFEVFGRDRFLLIDGLGASYGLERLTRGRHRAEGGPPELAEFAFGASEQGPAVLGSRQVQDRGVSVRRCVAGRRRSSHSRWRLIRRGYGVRHF